MSTITHKGATGAPGRHLPPPAWIFNNARLGEVLCRFMEERAALRNRAAVREMRKLYTVKERLTYAQKKLRASRPKLEATLKRLCARYVASKGAPKAVRDKLAIEIENRDTQLIILETGTALFVGVIYHYWHVGADSVATGLAMKIKPPHVRQILFRLNQTAKEIAREGWPTPPTVKPAQSLEEFWKMTEKPKAEPRMQKPCKSCCRNLSSRMFCSQTCGARYRDRLKAHRCVWCGGKMTFSGKHDAHRIHCSERCKYLRNSAIDHAKMRAKTKARCLAEPLFCKVCGKEITHRHCNRVTCSPACSQVHHRENSNKYRRTWRAKRKQKAAPMAPARDRRENVFLRKDSNAALD